MTIDATWLVCAAFLIGLAIFIALMPNEDKDGQE